MMSKISLLSSSLAHHKEEASRPKPTKREIAAQRKAVGADLKAIEDKIKTLAK
jgi:hypothetical protein